MANLLGIDSTYGIAEDIKNKALGNDNLLSVQPVSLNTTPTKSALDSVIGNYAKQEKNKVGGYSNVSKYDELVKLNDGTYVDPFEGEDYFVGTDNNERLAKQQSTGERWANGIAKLGIKTTTAAIGGTVGVLDSLVAGITSGSLSEATNSRVNTWLDDFNTKVDYKLPNLYTEEERNASLFGQMGQANFYADKLFGGLSFMTGAIISEAIWSAATVATFGGASAGLAANTARLGANLAKYSAKSFGGTKGFLKVFNAGKTMAKMPATAVFDDITLGVISNAQKAGAIKGFSLGKAFDIAIPMARSAAYEASFESRIYAKQTEEKWLEEYIKNNGEQPSTEEYTNFKDTLATSQNSVFFGNLGLLSVSNYYAFGKATQGVTTARTITNNAFGRNFLGKGFNKLEGGSLEAIKATGKQKAFGRVYGLGSSFARESQEEMGQSVITGTAENYLMAGYDKDKTKANYDVITAFGEAMYKTYTSKEGLTEGLIGGLIGVMGGVGGGIMNKTRGQSFFESDNELRDVEENVVYANGVTSSMHLNNVKAASKMRFAQEMEDVAVSRDDIPGQALAKTTSGIALIERNIAIGGLKEGIKDYENQVESLDSKELMEDMGFENEDQAEYYKTQLIEEHKTLAKNYETNLLYAETLIGQKDFQGRKDLAEFLKDDGISIGTGVQDLQRAMAMTFTMGEKSREIHRDISETLNEEIINLSSIEGLSEVNDVANILELAPRQKTLKLSQLNLQLFNLNREEKELVGKQIEASKVRDTTLVTPEESISRQNNLLEIQQQLIDLQNKKVEVENERQIALNGLDIAQYTSGVITADSIANHGKGIENFKEFMRDLKNKNPQKYDKIVRLLDQQDKSIKHIKNYQKAVNAITNKDTRLKTVNNWIATIFSKNVKLKEGQKEFFRDVLINYDTQTKIVVQESNNLKERKAFQNGEAVSEEYKKQLGEEVRDGIQLNSIDQEIYNAYKKEIDDNAKATIEDRSIVETPQNQVNTLQDLKDKVKEIISSNDYLTQYFGADLAEQKRTKPNSSDIAEYEELLSKIDRKVENNTSRIVSRPTGFYKNIGLTNEETDRLKELQTKLSDWVTLEGTVTNDNQSVAEMLELIDALQTQTAKETVKTELQDTDYKATIDALDEQANSLGSSVRGLSTPTSALVTVRDNNVRFSHIRVETLASFFPNSSLILNENKTFEITLNSGEVLRGKINERGGQDVTLKDWQAVRNLSTVLIKNFGTNSAAISQFMGLDSQGKELYQNVASDFDFQQTDGNNLVVDENVVNGVKNGDTLDLFVSSTDLFNSTLTNKELPSKIHIYVMKGGKLIGSLPAQELDSEGKVKENANGIGIALSDLRKSAVEFTKGKEGLILLPQKMTAQITFIGAPQITLEKVGEDVNTKNNPFTKEMLQNVVGQGFIENGKVTSTINIDVNQFINKVSSINKDIKIPFVAFNYNGKIVAFPISLNSFTADKSEGIFDGLETTAQKAKVLADTLNQNGLDASSYNINFTDKESWLDSQETQDALKDLSQVKEFVDIERFATKGYNKQNLIADATIAIDISNNPFQSSKIMLTTSDKIDSDILGYREFLAESERKEVEIRIALNDVAKQIYSKYLANEELDNKFTQTFDETPIIEGDSDIIMRRNINTLKAAIKGASAKTKAVIGADLFKNANDAIKELDYLAKKTKTVKEQIKNNEYYQDADPNFITVDEQGELENPNINQAQAIQELGGYKTEQEFKEVLENTNLEYLKTADIPFEEMSQFNRIPAKEIINGELADKPNTEVRDTLEATIKQPENTQLEEALLNLETFSESVWISSPQAVKTLLKEVEVRALDINVDVQGLSESGKSRSEILALTRALDVLIKDNSTQEDLDYFIAVYQDFMNVSQEPKITVLKVAEKYRNLPLITLETQESEYKLFKEQGLLKIQEGVYVKTDGAEKSLAEVEDLLATNAQVFPPNTIKGDTSNKELVKEDLNVYAESLMSDVLTNDAEYDLEAVKKLIYYKTYFGTINNKKQPVNFQTQLSQLVNVEINNGVYLKNDLIADIRNKQLKKEDNVLDNLMFSEKGITLRYTDEISVAEMNEYLKDNIDLRNYFLLSKFTNFEVANVEQNEVFNERDLMANGMTKEEYKGDYRKIDQDTIQTKTSEDFITINDENYERIESDFFAKIVKNETEFLQQNVEKPILNIDIANFSSTQSEVKSEVKNQYNKTQEKTIDESKDCSK